MVNYKDKPYLPDPFNLKPENRDNRNNQHHMKHETIFYAYFAQVNEVIM
jgi:hypothetical protein